MGDKGMTELAWSATMAAIGLWQPEPCGGASRVIGQARARIVENVAFLRHQNKNRLPASREAALFRTPLAYFASFGTIGRRFRTTVQLP